MSSAPDVAVSLSVSKAPASALVGTAESPDVAFQLFFDGAPSLLGSVGLPSCAHVAVYGPDYFPALPIVLLTLPVLTGGANLPPAVATALAARDAAADVELHIVAHGAPRLPAAGACAHIGCAPGRRCARAGEVNVLLHAWLFADDCVGDGRHAVSARAEVGLFCAAGAAAAPGGDALRARALAARAVIIHGGAFSPHNCTLRLTAASGTAASFITAAYDRATRRALVTLHVLPADEPAADALRGWLRGCATLRELLRGLAEHLPAAHAIAARLVAPLLAADEAAELAAALRAGGGAGGEALWRDGMEAPAPLDAAALAVSAAEPVPTT